MSLIKPVSIPNAAAENFGEGDVRHFQEGDDMSVPGISNPTRQLAHRDNEIASTLNEVVSAVNNKEQFVPLPVVRTVLPQESEDVVVNWRIPEGFEARIINATVASSPASSDVLLNVYFSTGFGNSTGESLVSTASEFTSGSEFKNSGELIIQLVNIGSVSLEITASVLLTMRPIGDSQGLLITSDLTGAAGPAGSQGPAGVGVQGATGAPGSSGMVWSGVWNSGATYSPPQVVSFDAGGGLGVSSYISTQLTSPGESPTSAPSKWDLVAQSGSSGTGASGFSGLDGFQFQGEWNSGTTYTKNDVVTYTSGSDQGTWYAGLNDILPSVGVAPPGTGWTQLFAQSVPVFAAETVDGFFYTEADYVQGVADAGFLSVAPGTYPLSFEQTTLLGPNSPKGTASIKTMQQISFGGAITFRLPTVGENLAEVSYQTDDATISVDSFGTVTVSGSNQFTVFNPQTRATTMSIRADSIVS